MERIYAKLQNNDLREIYFINNPVQSIQHSMKIINDDYTSQKTKMIHHICTRVERLINTPAEINEWNIEFINGRNFDVVCHKLDALNTLDSLDKIAVFYYQRDSIGEGGSEQWWMGPRIFHMVLDKMVDGGIITTDGSNRDPYYKDTQWCDLSKHNLPLIKNSTSYNFKYKDSKFEYVGNIGQGYGPVCAWRVRE